jgi:hypothetical protein
MEPLFAWVFLAVITERFVEVLTKLIPALDQVTIKEFDLKLAIAFAAGLVLAIGAGLDFFDMVGIEFAWPYVGQTTTAFFIMAGSNYINDIISMVRRDPE